MNARIKQLRDLVVALDRADRNQQQLDPDTYRAAAKAALSLTKQEMGLLPMADFAGPVDVEIRMPGGQRWAWKQLAVDRLHMLELSDANRIPRADPVL